MILDSSRRSRRQVPAYHRGDLPPAVDPAQLDLPARYEAEEQDDGGVLTRERALRLYPAAIFFVESLDDVCGAQRLPLPLRESEEGEEFVAAFPQAGHDTGPGRPQIQEDQRHADPECYDVIPGAPQRGSFERPMHTR